MHNTLHYSKIVQNPAWLTLVPVLNTPEYITVVFSSHNFKRALLECVFTASALKSPLYNWLRIQNFCIVYYSSGSLRGMHSPKCKHS